MVLERVIQPKLLEQHFLYAALLGAGHALIGLVLASFIFPQNTGIVSIIFTSLLLAPSLTALLREEEALEEQETTFSLQHLLRDNYPLLKAYTGIFVGVFATYFLVAALLPALGYSTFSLLREQLSPAIAGYATNQLSIFTSILANNWLVLVVTFLLALLVGDGAIFFVVWNASAWGAIFGYRAFAAAQVTETGILLTAATLLAIVLWHTLIEGGAYILAALSGAAISEAVIKRSDELHRFLGYAALIITGYFALSLLTQPLATPTRLLILIPALLGGLYVLAYAFTVQKHKEVFTYNYWLFILAILVFLAGAALETAVLTHSDALGRIYFAAALY